MLVADIGNTDIVFGLFQNSSLSKTFRIPAKKGESAPFFSFRLVNYFLENQIDPNLFKTTVLSSVVPELTPVLEEVLKEISQTDVIIVRPGIHRRVTVGIDNPDQLGTDLYSNAVAAFMKYTCASIVVDFGTALTFTAVNKEGEVMGVAIAPGLKTAVNSLFSNTSQLPDVPLELPITAIGRNSMTSIQSGILYGYEGLVKNLVDKFKSEMNDPLIKVVATGGLSSIIPGLKSWFDEVDINLTLKGLGIIGDDYK